MSNDEESASTSDELLGFIEGSLKNLTDLVQTANTLPSGSARDLYCTYSAFNRITEVLTENIIDLSNNILDMQDIKPKFKKEICLEFKDSNTLVDCNDQVLDNMDTLMDSMEGYKRTVAPPPPASGAHVSSWNKSPIIKTKTPSLPVGTPPPFKPQAAFKDAVDNSTIPWKPTITEKPNSVVELSLVPQFDEIGDVMGYAHPYATELQQYTPLSKFLAVSTDIAVTTENTKFTYINNLSELEQLVEHLRTVDVVAVDMEHNSQRSYQGITCLVQITTESGGDFVIDTLVLREHLHLLNEAFTDPCILKVFHGAYNDILWLQRDFAVYVVGLFDTYIAAQKLGLPVKSLQALVKTYCDVYIDKKYQTADWRIRPLPQAMIDYARMDTHYLIYIYKCMTKDLAGKACGEAYVYSVHEQSRIICMAKYEKPKAIDENSHLLLVSRYHFSPQQMIAAKWLFKWRDEVARKEDEGVQYVMPDHMLVRLAELQPRDVQGVLGIWNPLPPLLRQYLTQVHTILLASREFSAPNPMPSSAHLAAWPAEVPSAFAPHDTLSWAGNSEELPDASLGHQQLYGITGNDPSADNTHGDITNMSDLINGPHRSNSGSGDFARGTSAIAHKFKITTTSSGKAVFLPPYDRYRKYRSITKDDETKKLRQTEAKIFAINKNSSIPVTRIIEKDLVSKHEEAHLNIDSAP